MTHDMRLLIMSVAGCVAGGIATPIPVWAASRHAQLMATYPGRVEHEQVVVAVEILSADQTKEIFNADLLRKNIQPISIMIHNGSGYSYEFAKAKVEAQAIAAGEAARAAYPNPALTGVRVVKWLVLWVPVSIAKFFVNIIPAFYFPSISEANRRPLLAGEVRDEFAQVEIPDKTIAPNESVDGFLFARPLPPGRPLHLSLVNAQTRQPLGFEIPVAASPPPPENP